MHYGIHRYFVLHKPINMVSQFVSSHQVPLLGSIPFNFPDGTHAIGRLDKNSEGLLLLTTDSRVTKLLFHGHQPHSRKYLVQVNKNIQPEKIQQLANGVAISAASGKTYVTKPCEVQVVEKPEYIVEKSGSYIHPNIMNSWITITLTEGKFHQVRKMIAAVKHKCLRLIRISIEEIELAGIQPGEVIEVSESFFYEKLKL